MIQLKNIFIFIIMLIENYFLITFDYLVINNFIVTSIPNPHGFIKRRIVSGTPDINKSKKNKSDEEESESSDEANHSHASDDTAYGKCDIENLEKRVIKDMKRMQDDKQREPDWLLEGDVQEKVLNDEPLTKILSDYFKMKSRRRFELEHGHIKKDDTLSDQLNKMEIDSKTSKRKLSDVSSEGPETETIQKKIILSKNVEKPNNNEYSKDTYSNLNESPLDQFKIKKLFDIHFLDIHIPLIAVAIAITIGLIAFILYKLFYKKKK